MASPVQTKHPKTRVGLVLLRPSQYDDDGYVMQWHKIFISTHVVAVVDGLFQDLNTRQALGPDVEVITRYIEEQTQRVDLPKLMSWMDSFDHAAVLMVGVQTSQYPRSVDLGRQFTERGYTVILGGFHVSGSLSMVPDWSPALQDARDAKMSLFAGELETHAETLVRDIMGSSVKPVYNMLSVTANMKTAPMASYSEAVAEGTLQKVTGLDVGRGCPFQCSFCTIINVHGRTMRERDPAAVEAYIRHWVTKGRRYFLVVDDNFARSPIWREVTEILARVQREMAVELDVFIQVDTLATRTKGFVDACKAAGVKRVFIGMESVREENLAAASKGQNKLHQMRDMLMAWKRAGIMIYAGYILGFPSDTPERVAEDIQSLQDHLPIDILELSILTPFPGSADHKTLVARGERMDEDFNFYDASHVVTDHPLMDRATWEGLYWRVFDQYFSPAHRKTVMGRALYYNLPVSEVRRSLIGIYGAARYDRMHPIDAGVIRIRRRLTRRPGMPIESRWGFIRHTVPKWLATQWGYASLIAHMAVVEAGLRWKKWRTGLDEYALEAPEPDKATISAPQAAE